MTDGCSGPEEKAVFEEYVVCVKSNDFWHVSNIQEKIPRPEKWNFSSRNTRLKIKLGESVEKRPRSEDKLEEVQRNWK